MNNKGFSSALLVIIALVVLVGGYWFLSRQARVPGEKEAPIKGFEEILKKIEGEVEKPAAPPSQADIKETVTIFIDSYIKQAPPTFDDRAVITALDLLSKKAQQSIERVGPSPNAALSTFAGFPEVPDKGYTIDAVYEDKGTAEVQTTWNWTAGSSKKVFHLVFEEDSWKIDSIN